MVFKLEMSGIKRTDPLPAIGVAFDAQAKPVDSPFPYEDVKFEGSPPEPRPMLYMEPFGFYLGNVWWVRLPKEGQEYKVSASYTGEYVADHQPLTVEGRVSNHNGVDVITFSVRPSSSFRTAHRGRTSYRTPILVPPAQIHELAATADLAKLPNGEPETAAKACSTSLKRTVIIADDDNLDRQGHVGALYRVDTAVPKLATEDTLAWKADSAEVELAPVASVISRGAEQESQDAIFWASILGSLSAPIVGFGVSGLWRKIRDRRNSRPPRDPPSPKSPTAGPRTPQRRKRRGKKRR
jgi:hypothetical protein